MKSYITSIFSWTMLFALPAALVGGAIFVTPVRAAGIVVNINTDITADDGYCTLREAINAANLNTYSGSKPGECAAGSSDGVDSISFADNYIITVGDELPYVISPIMITGRGATNTIIQAATSPNLAKWRIFQVAFSHVSRGNLTLDQVTVRNGYCDSEKGCTALNEIYPDAGGAIYNSAELTVKNSVISENFATYGGGIFNEGTLAIANTVFSGNNSHYTNGGVYNFGTMTVIDSTFSGNSAGTTGGGIYNEGSLTVTNSTFSDNSAGYEGGGVYNWGSLTMINNTFRGNSATEAGGGIYNDSDLTLMSSTMLGNSATSGGGIYNEYGRTAILKNTIVANSSGENCLGTITNEGNNLDSGASCGWASGNGSLSNTDPKLGVLSNNGGPTKTIALLTGSPAINAGNDVTCPSTDQRGVARPQGSHCDIGAYEFAPNIDVDIMIGAYRMGTYPVYPNPSLIKNYLNKVNGPVKVKSTNGAKIFTSQRAYYGNSYNELMGYPSNKFTTEYWFPWYDHVYMQTWILVGNPGINYQTAYVDIYIGGVKRNNTSGGVPYAIQPSDRVTPVFPGVLDGPVKVVSVTGPGTSSPLPIFASERSLYSDSFNEVMGYPSNKFTTEYWFPWYDQIYMKSWILVGNPSTTKDAYVDIYINSVRQKDMNGNATTYKIPPGQRITPQFPGIVDGPVKVVSVTGTGVSTPTPIFTSERSLYGTSFNEVMGYPANEFTTEYNYTWYDNQIMQTWVLVGNPSTTQTAYVDIYIGGQRLPDIVNGQVQTYVLKPGERITPQFNANTGPVKVVSKTGLGTTTPVNIFTSERALYRTGFNEMMGYPTDQLTSEYWFTWYDSIYMNTDVLVGRP